MRLTASLAAIALYATAVRAQEEYEDTFYVTIQVPGPVLEVDGEPIAEVDRTFWEELHKITFNEEEDEDEIYATDPVEWYHGTDFHIDFLEGFTLSDGESIHWYQCIPGDTADYECEIVSYSIDSGVTSYSLTTTTVPSDYFDLGGQDPLTDASAITTTTDMTSFTSETDNVTYDGEIMTSIWINDSELATDGHISFVDEQSLGDELDATRQFLYNELTFTPDSPCYVLEEADEEDFHEIWGIIYNDVIGTQHTEWAEMEHDIFDETHAECSGASTLAASLAAAVVAILAF